MVSSGVINVMSYCYCGMANHLVTYVAGWHVYVQTIDGKDLLADCKIHNTGVPACQLWLSVPVTDRRWQAVLV